jgi:DNA invertase Pin-like site-specific DNA recombinase
MRVPVFRGYIRVSTIEQGLSYSPATQREKLERAAKQMNLAYSHYEDHYSGKTFDRKDFNRLMADLKPGDVIGVRDAKRLGRNLKEGVEFIYELVEAKVPLLYVKNRLYNINDKKDRHDLQQDLNDAEYDYEERREVSAEGIKKKQELGEWKFSSRLMGYDHPKDGTIAINETEAKTIREMVGLYVGGMSFRKIATLLNERGTNTRKGNHWSPSTVRRLLLNPIIAGRYIPRKWTGNTKTLSIEKIKIEDLIESTVYKPIITMEEYKSILSSYRGVKRTHARQFGYRYRSYLLTGLVKCSDCEKLGKNVRYVHSHHKSRAKSQKVNPNYTSRLHVKGCKNRFKTFRETVFNNLVECVFYLVFLEPSQLIAFVGSELGIIREQLVSQLSHREDDMEGMEKLKKKLDHMNRKLSELKSKIETEEDEDKIVAFEQAQEATLIQRVGITKKIKSLEPTTGGVLTYLDSNENEHEIDLTSLGASEKEDMISAALDDAAEELSSKFGEEKLFEFLQLSQDGDRRLVLIDFIKEIGVQHDKLMIDFKNGKEFRATLNPNRGRTIQKVFSVTSFFNVEEEGTFLIDTTDKSIHLEVQADDEDPWKNKWKDSLKGNLNRLQKKINKFQTLSA